MRVSEGIVRAPRAGGAWVSTTMGQRSVTVLARNALNVRVPPGSRVVVGLDDRGGWVIVGRER